MKIHPGKNVVNSVLTLRRSVVTFKQSPMKIIPHHKPFLSVSPSSSSAPDFSRFFSKDPSADSVAVTHCKDDQMFSIAVTGHDVAYLKYRYMDTQQTIVEMFTTVVPPSLGGRGVAKLLADDAFNWAVKNDMKMKLSCWYLSGYLRRHPRDDVVKLVIS